MFLGHISKYIKMKLIVSCVLCICLTLTVYSASEGDTFFGHKVEDDETCSGLDCGESTTLNNVDPDDLVDLDNKVNEPEEINVVITFTNAAINKNLQKKFTLTVSSMLHHSTIPLAIHIIGDEESRKIAETILTNNAGEAKYRMINLDVDKMAHELDDIVKPMQQHFSYKPGSYYNHALFFLSIAIHRIMPETMEKVVMIDADLKFMDDIKKLYQRFRLFKKDHVMGLAREMQPVYRHSFWEYRQKNPGTRVGEPGPEGLTGFNSGVILLNLKAMRQSDLYNSILNDEAVERLTKEFYFKGHLGDQDLFTLINMKYEWLFHVLPCVWNRQLCNWWKEHGYKDVFDQYYTCDGDVKIWHGNCNTPIP